MQHRIFPLQQGLVQHILQARIALADCPDLFQKCPVPRLITRPRHRPALQQCQPMLFLFHRIHVWHLDFQQFFSHILTTPIRHAETVSRSQDQARCGIRPRKRLDHPTQGILVYPLDPHLAIRCRGGL